MEEEELTVENFLPTSLTLHGRGAGAGGRRCSGTREGGLQCLFYIFSFLPGAMCCVLCFIFVR